LPNGVPDISNPAAALCGSAKLNFALLAEFDSPGALLTAAEKVRDAGYTRWDTHSPFPVHGIDEAMGVRRTRLPWIVFAAGVIGCLAGLGLQWWTNASRANDFPRVPTALQGFDFVSSGKPRFSLPANIPVIFETTVLLAAVAAVIGMLVLNNLPRHRSPLLGHPRFRRVTTDRFYVCIDAADPRFEPAATRSFLESLGSLAVEPIADAPARARLPAWVTIGALVVAALALLPPLLVAKARLTKTTHPRLHLVQDMDNQERFKAQQAAPLFADGRELRPPVAGTVARGDLHEDPHYYKGRLGDRWATTFPPQVRIDVPFVRRGQQRFNIYCAPCHGLAGAGDGIVHQRALLRETTPWTQPTSLVDELVRGRTHGEIFNTITSGMRTMPPYADQIPVADRWAIVAYVRALQRGQNARVEDVPEDTRGELR